MISLASSFKLNEALELGHSILSQLGEGIQDNPSAEEVTQQIHHTMSIICDMPQVKLLNHFVMTDKNKLSAMRFLARLQSIAYFVKPSLNPYLLVKMVNTTLTFGEFIDSISPHFDTCIISTYEIVSFNRRPLSCCSRWPIVVWIAFG